MRRSVAVGLTVLLVGGLYVMGTVGSVWIISQSLTEDEAQEMAEYMEATEYPGEKWVGLLNLLTFWPAVVMVGWIWYKAAETAKKPPAFCKQCGWTPSPSTTEGGEP